MMTDNNLFEGLHFCFHSEGEVCYNNAEMDKGDYSELGSQQVIEL